jgi:hypothetical protein
VLPYGNPQSSLDEQPEDLNQRQAKPQTLQRKPPQKHRKQLQVFNRKLLRVYQRSHPPPGLQSVVLRRVLVMRSEKLVAGLDD